MARKPKRTRREIEETLLRNVRLNMTPAEVEDAADKRKRQKRRSPAKRGLEKELAALTLAEADNSVPGATSVITVADGPTEGHEDKQEEDDPAEHQRRYTAALRVSERRHKRLTKSGVLSCALRRLRNSVQLHKLQTESDMPPDALQ
ncbi:hypothetical protein PF004_g22258 [Phytophthora fragariae]|uniref:Uncharacterized protein n=2 Tax=Phytophthora fragariae TaxID=53985 RepID=A0A6G0N0M0_9STRA|nr:hypothetical protein PF004_g22258 [Phytophthora fragariae]